MNKINYEELTEITVKSQKELDMIPDDFAGRIFIQFGKRSSPAIVDKLYKRSVVAQDNSFVVACNNSSIEARDNSSIEARDNSSVNACGNSFVKACDNSSVNACGNSFVKARHDSTITARVHSYVKATDNSSVEARDNSFIVAGGNSSVIARGNSSVIAWAYSSVMSMDKSSVKAYHYSSVYAANNSSVEAWDNTSVVAYGCSSVKAFGNSSVENYGNSSVQASGNSQITNFQPTETRIQISGNSRIMYNPKTVDEYVSFYGIKHNKKTGRFFKAVHRSKYGCFYSNFDCGFRYAVGETEREPCDPNTAKECSYGIHISHLDWALNYGSEWSDLAIIEVETDLDKVVVPIAGNGKVRTSEVKVLREVPLEECGIYGKMLARRFRQAQN